MRIRYNHLLDNSPHVYDVRGNYLRIGRAADNDIVLNSPFIADRAVEILKKAEGWELVVIGGGVCQVGDRDMYLGEKELIADDVAARPRPVHAAAGVPARRQANGRQPPPRARSQALGLRLGSASRTAPADGSEDRSSTTAAARPTNTCSCSSTTSKRSRAFAACLKPENDALILHVAGHALRSELLNDLLNARPRPSDDSLTGDAHWSRIVSIVADRERELAEANTRLDEAVGTCRPPRRSRNDSKRSNASFGRPSRRRPTPCIATSASTWPFATSRSRSKTSSSATARSKTCSACRPCRKSWSSIASTSTSRSRACSRTPAVASRPTKSTLAIIERIVSRVGRRIDKSQPLVDARLWRRQPRERRDSAAGRQRAVHHDSQVSVATTEGRRPHRQRKPHADGRRVSQGRRALHGPTSSSPAAPAAAKRRCSIA